MMRAITKAMTTLSKRSIDENPKGAKKIINRKVILEGTQTL